MVELPSPPPPVVELTVDGIEVEATVVLNVLLSPPLPLVELTVLSVCRCGWIVETVELPVVSALIVLSVDDGAIVELVELTSPPPPPPCVVVVVLSVDDGAVAVVDELPSVG